MSLKKLNDIDSNQEQKGEDGSTTQAPLTFTVSHLLTKELS